MVMSVYTEHTADKNLRILEVLDKRTDVLLNSVLLRSGLTRMDGMINEDFNVTMDLRSSKPGVYRHYDDKIRKLIYGYIDSYLADTKQPLDAVATKVVVSGSKWTITIGSARYMADASGLRFKPKEYWTLSLLRADDYYTSNPLRSFVMCVNGDQDLEFSLVT